MAFRRRDRGSNTGEPAESTDDLVEKAVPSLAIDDDEVGTFRAFHFEAIPERRGGDYYIAPDSAEPLPDAIWKDLDPAVVEREAEALNRLNGGRGLQIEGDLDEGLKALLEEHEDLGRQVIRLLESGSAESVSSLLDQD